jgi:hypothetical protein
LELRQLLLFQLLAAVLEEESAVRPDLALALEAVLVQVVWQIWVAAAATQEMVLLCKAVSAALQ